MDRGVARVHRRTVSVGHLRSGAGARQLATSRPQVPLKFVVHKLKKVFLNSHFSGRNVGGWRLNWGMNHLSDALNALDEYVAAALMTSSLGGRFLVPLTVLCWMRWRSPRACNAASMHCSSS